MLISNIEQLALRLASMAGVIYVAEKANLMRMFFQAGDSEAMLAVKTSVLLSLSEYGGDMILSKVLSKAVPSLSNNLRALPYAFLSNTIVLYIMEKLRIDDAIVRDQSEEMRAIEWAILFIIAQEVTYYFLNAVFRNIL